MCSVTCVVWQKWESSSLLLKDNYFLKSKIMTHINVKLAYVQDLSKWKWKKVAQLYLTLCRPMDCNPSGSSVHGILQARILEWVAICFSRGSSWPRDWTWVSCITGRFFTNWTTREALYMFINILINIWYLDFSFWLTTFHVTGSRFAYLSSTNFFKKLDLILIDVDTGNQ